MSLKYERNHGLSLFFKLIIFIVIPSTLLGWLPTLNQPVTPGPES